jgi:hypothetical protein
LDGDWDGDRDGDGDGGTRKAASGLPGVPPPELGISSDLIGSMCVSIYRTRQLIVSAHACVGANLRCIERVEMRRRSSCMAGGYGVQVRK